MSQEIGIERRLAAVLAADVAGFSRLTEADEVGTMRLLAAQRAILDSAIARHRGRIANTAGDSVLAEFPSAVNAVQCAVEAQQALRDAAEAVEPERRVLFRIGIHVGDVMVRGGDLLGTGVNVAARLEALAEAGGIVVSAAAHEQVKKILPLAYTDLGAQVVKNIQEPVRAFAVGVAAGAPTIEQVSKPLALPDKPSIAVLPFQNMSGDPEQEYFADGMVEDIITALSRFKSLFVIARNSSFAYKGKSPDIRQVGRELGVRYVLEGSVRKAGNRLRITGQLIDAITGAHLWADRFEGSLDNVFELQDHVASSVVGALDPRLLEAEIARVKRKPVANLAYDCYLRAADCISRWTRKDYEDALPQLYKAIELDPNFAEAYAYAGWCLVFLKTMTGARPSEEDRRKARRLAREAIRLGKDDAFSVVWAGFTLASFATTTSEIEEGAALIDRSLSLNPNLARGWNLSGWIRSHLGQQDVAIEHFERAIRLSPMDTALHAIEWGMSTAHLRAGLHDKAADWAERSLRSNSNYNVGAALCLVLSRAYAGDFERARDAGMRLLQMRPDWRISTSHAVQDAPAERRSKMIDALRNAGLPE